MTPTPNKRLLREKGGFAPHLAGVGAGASASAVLEYKPTECPAGSTITAMAPTG